MPGGSRESLFPCLFQLGCRDGWAHVPSVHVPAQQRTIFQSLSFSLSPSLPLPLSCLLCLSAIVSSLTFNCLRLSYKYSWTHWNNPGLSRHMRTINLMISTESLFLCRVTYRLWGFRYWTFWGQGGIMQPTIGILMASIYFIVISLLLGKICLDIHLFISF